MKFSTVEQLIRIGLYILGTYLFGSAFATGEMFQSVIGASISLASFGWWLYFEYQRPNKQ